MEIYVQEFEPKVKSLFSEVNFEGFDLFEFMSKVAMDFLEDLVEGTNQQSPEELLRAPKYHCFIRFLKEARLEGAFIELADEYWKKAM